MDRMIRCLLQLRQHLHVAIQMARAMGHRVFATAGTPEKCAACVALGAERAINYKTEDFVEVIKSATDGRGVDVILDMVAGDYLQREISALADDGRIVIIAFLGGPKSTIDTGQVMRVYIQSRRWYW